MPGIGVKRSNGSPAAVTALRAAAVALFAISMAFGRQWLVSDIRFTGNRSFSEEELSRTMETKPTHFWSKSVYSESKALDDVAALAEWYRRQGFLDAEIALSSVERDTSEYRVSITVGIDEGPRTLVDGVSIVFTGTRVMSDSAARAKLATKAGEPLGVLTIDDDARILTDVLGGKGYLYARVEDCVSIDTSRRRGTVTFSVDPGPVVVAGEIDVEGERKVRPGVVLGELEFESGEVVTSKAVRESIERLYRTGLFSLVVIEPRLESLTENERLRDTIVEPVTVGIREAYFFSVDAAAGYGSYERFRGSILLSYGNLFGLGHAVTFEGSLNRLRQMAEVTYSFPSLFSRPVRTDITPYIEHANLTYLGLFYGLRLAVNQEVGPYLTYRVYTRFERVGYLYALDDENDAPSRTNTQSIGSDIIFDSRRGIRDTARGIHARFSPELAGLGGGGTNQYYRGLLDLRGYYNAARRLGLSSAINIGYARGYGTAGSEVPAQALYYRGVEGMRQLRGYPIDETGGQLALVVNLLEIRFPIYRWFGGLLFTDAGGLWTSPRISGSNDFQWTAGPGVFVRSPFGYVELDWGYRFDEREWGSPYFSIGRAF